MLRYEHGCRRLPRFFRGADPRWHTAARADTPRAATSGGGEWLSGAEKPVVPCVAEPRRGTVRSGEEGTAPGCDGRALPGGVRGRSAVGRRFCDAKRDVAT